MVAFFHFTFGTLSRDALAVTRQACYNIKRKRVKNVKRKMIALGLAGLFLLTACGEIVPAPVSTDAPTATVLTTAGPTAPGEMTVLQEDVMFLQTVSVDRQKETTVHSFCSDYPNNQFLSLRDVATALSGTNKEFVLRIKKGVIFVETGHAAIEPAGEFRQSLTGLSPTLNQLFVGDRECKYYSFLLSDSGGAQDAFLAPVDIAMILNTGLAYENGKYTFSTDKPFSADPEQLKETGFFDNVNACAVTDLKTGEVLFSFEGTRPVPIASTTKVMTMLLVAEAIKAGQLSESMTVPVSEAAARLSLTDDGVFALEAGKSVSVSDLIAGMMIASSNECALMLAEAVAGSEAAFVKQMNEKALALGMTDARYFTCNGLPIYTLEVTPSKRQNLMSAESLAKLVKALLEEYPGITAVTSEKQKDLPTLGVKAASTNPMLWNLPQATGLKTGTTNRAGYCLITTVTSGNASRAVVLLGAETISDRNRKSEVLARWALQSAGN